MIQALVNAVTTTASILPIALDVFLVYRLFRFFPFTSAAMLSLAPYLVASLVFQTQPVVGLLAALLGLLALAAAAGWLFATLGPLRGGSPLQLFLLSLGLMVTVQNTIAMLFGLQPTPLALLPGRVIAIGNAATVGPARVAMLAWAVIALLLFVAIQRFTRLGIYWRGLADDPELAEILGLEPRKPLLAAFCLGAIFSGGAGVLLAADTAMTPYMGLREFMIAVVAVVIGGQRLAGVLLATVLAASTLSFGGYLLGGRWQDAVLFAVLLAFLLCRPHGLTRTDTPAQTV